MNKIIQLFTLLLISHLCFAQSDSDKDQQLIYTYLYSKELEKAKTVIDSKFLKSGNDTRKVIGYVYLADYYSFSDNEKMVEALKNAQKIATRTKIAIDMAYVEYGYARYYKKINKDDLFIKSINHSINIFSNHSNENFILTLLYFLKVSYKAKNLLEKDTRSDYIKANQYALKSKNNILINFTYNNLGYYYKGVYNLTGEEKYLDSVSISYENSYNSAKLISDSVAKKRSVIVYYLNSGGIAKTNTESLNIYNKALLLSEKDENFKEITALLYNNIGSLYEKSGEYNTAELYFLKSYHLTKDNDEIYALTKIKILENLSILYKKQNQFEKALNFEIKARELVEQNNQKVFDENTKSLEIFYQTEQKSQQIKQLEEKNAIYNKQKLLYLGITLLSIIVIIFLILLLRSRQKLSRQRTNLLEAEKNEAEFILQLEKEEKARLEIEQELLAIQQGKLQKQALATTLQLNQKTTFINELKEKIKNKDVLNLEKILKEEQLTDNDFNEIQNIIQEVHPDFFKCLNEISKNRLTNLDLKYAAYIYLHMDNQQISNILKADPNTVKTTKYRLKQKLGLKKEDDLQTFIQNLDL